MTTEPGHTPPQQPNGWWADPPQPPTGQHPTGPYAQQPHPGPDFWFSPEHQQLPAPAPVWHQPQRGGSRRAVMGIAAAAIIAAAAGASVVAVAHSSNSGPGQTSAITSPNSPFSQNGGGFGNPGGSSGSSGTSGSSGQGQPPGSGGTTTTTGRATAAQQIGVVDINTVINYGQERAAGTGMVLTSNGEILTNNHVIDGSTSISVTIVTTGKSYNATVVGTDPTDDVAVLQLSGASGLSTANIGDSSKVAVGDTVTGVGNAGGTGGVPSAATGTVTALNQPVTASDGNGSNSETLTGMIQIVADIQAGDSGGPLYAADNTVIGMDTAASADTRTTTEGFAIPIAKATSIAAQIESGQASSTIHIGSTGFLGVELGQGGADAFASTGAAISGVVDNSAAAKAGLAAGDTITGVNGTTIGAPTDLSTAISKYAAGEQVSITWLDSSGQSHTANVTLGKGPAD